MKKVCLQFSGGKDSLACLELLRPYLSEIDVVWCNSGALLPETLEYISNIRKTIPNFIEVAGKQPETRSRFGLPSDLVPVNFSRNSFLVGNKEKSTIQNYIDCCKDSIWFPLAEACKKYKIIIRGQKMSDILKGLTRNGYHYNGVTYIMPIEGWSDSEVFTFLESRNVQLPPQYSKYIGSGDCWNCTAFLPEAKNWLSYLETVSVEKANQLKQDWKTILASVQPSVNYLQELI